MTEILHRQFEIARHHGLHRIVIEADDAAQKADGQQVLPLGFLFDNDLGEHLMGDVLARLGIAHDELRPALDHLAEMIEGDVTAGRGVVEAAIGVFFYSYGLGVGAAG